MLINKISVSQGSILGHLDKTKIINFTPLIYQDNSIILNNTQTKNVIPIIFYLNYQKYLFTYINYHFLLIQNH